RPPCGGHPYHRKNDGSQSGTHYEGSGFIWVLRIPALVTPGDRHLHHAVRVGDASTCRRAKRLHHLALPASDICRDGCSGRDGARAGRIRKRVRSKVGARRSRILSRLEPVRPHLVQQVVGQVGRLGTIVRALRETQVHRLQQREAEQPQRKHQHRHQHLDHAEARLAARSRRATPAIHSHGHACLVERTWPVREMSIRVCWFAPDLHSTGFTVTTRASLLSTRPRLSNTIRFANVAPPGAVAAMASLSRPATWRIRRSPAPPGWPLPSASIQTIQPSSQSPPQVEPFSLVQITAPRGLRSASERARLIEVISSLLAVLTLFPWSDSWKLGKATATSIATIAIVIISSMTLKPET